ncbi:NADH dehydrogenase subunit 6 (mitochondrion) [Alligator mississippiensis]|uniref:NADH-ubiquinone oxidoreductase chain 6 n=2 Tax=Alligator mississippiensis TaxID=8496 RepID=O47877_ALLMI|nr:NADH dehydrogenase subunit 6 [Alligator mississippiensis]CAA73572.1 NADH dehydrogenase subunit 6 [Alligator mississippiensis]
MGFTLFLCCLMLACAMMVAASSMIHFAVVSLLFVVVFGSGLLIIEGGSFMPLVVLLVYLGGLLVVFAFCVGFTDDPFGGFWGVGVSKWVVFFWWAGFFRGVYSRYWRLWCWGKTSAGEFWGEVVSSELLGVSQMYSDGWAFIVVCGWALLVVLFVITGFVRGYRQGAFRSF